MEDVLKITEKTARVLEIMRAEDAPMVPADIAEHDTELFVKGAKSVSPLMNTLFNNGLVTKDKVSQKVVDKDGKEVVKEYTQYTLTDAGKSVVYEIKAAK